MMMFSAENVNIITCNNNCQGFILYENFQVRLNLMATFTFRILTSMLVISNKKLIFS